MMTHDTEGGDGPQHRSSVHIKLEHQGNLRMVQHGLRTIQTLHTSLGLLPPLSPLRMCSTISITTKK